MKIYALFREEKYFQCALLQGKQFAELGDEQWEQQTYLYSRVFNHNKNDWIEISEEDYKLYKKGYTRSEEGTPIAPEPIVKTTQEQLQDIQTQFISELQELGQEYVNAQMAGIDTTPIQKTYTELVESSNEKAIKVIENGE